MDGFIDGDAALGMSSAAPTVAAQASQEMVDEAAAMLRMAPTNMIR